MSTAKEKFILANWSNAVASGLRWGLNPNAILAVAGKESGWGTSYSARHRLNFFGLMARKGGQRVFATARECFEYFARLIAQKYEAVAVVSGNAAAFGKRLAYSRYVAESAAGKAQYAATMPLFWQQVAKVASRHNLTTTPAPAEPMLAETTTSTPRS